MLPEVAEPEKSTMIEFVPFPEVIVAPAGNVQLYEVAFEMAAIEKETLFCPWQTGVVPLIVPAWAGMASTVTAKGGDTLPVPQLLVP